MVAVGLRAADVGVEGFEAVDQAVLHQEIERAIDGRRRRAAAVALQLLEQLVGADGRVAAPDQLQHAAADVGQPGAPAAAQCRGAVERLADAVPMIVRLAAERARGSCGASHG